MAINQTIFNPLTLFSGSLSAHTVAGGATQGQLMGIITSSLPTFQGAFWNYKIKTDTTYVTSATAENISELIVNMTDTTAYYLIIGYHGIGCSSVTSAPRLGNSLASSGDSTTYVEMPTSTTNTQIAYQSTTGINATTWPSADIDNFYLCKFVLLGKPSATTATFQPNLAVNVAGAGITASMGPSVVFWRKF